MIRGHEHRAFRDYLVYEKRFSPHTVQAYQSDTDQFLTFAEVQYGLISVSEIGPLHIRAWMVDMLEHGISPRAINRKLSCLKTFFRFLLKRGWVQQSPMLKILAPKTGKALPVFVREEHLAQLLDEVVFPAGFEGARDRMMLELLYMTGLRRAELMGMTPESADFHRMQIRVKGKGGKERIIPILPDLAERLRAYIDLRRTSFEELPANLLLTDKGAPMYPKFVYRVVRKYLSMVTTVEKRSPHVLRHSFATHLSNKGADINAIKELLGHSSLAATQVYTHNAIEKLKEVYQLAHPKGKPKG
ncbi:MAG: tyrosine-type recombinase/integrase [Saprospirales bacterium]|jgi:integrase/recombinase XerC|nr:tyrosine-type recombinase/integrase [Saprospirales bacterium]MBK7336769.1 tyrosine-type recombinase/integrase [Saprospirales bacterium]